MVLAALGIVFGDLGTSPLYTLQTILGATGGKLDPGAAIGILSLLFWALIITISIKYCGIVMRADNRGEGGILALMSLIGLNRTRDRRWLLAAALFGAALIYGDGIITPAISVLSALEGINVATSALKPYVMPAAAVILLGLFAVQSRGTAVIGRIFGPVMLLWFLVIGVIGAVNLFDHPGVLVAVDPRHAVEFLVHHGWASFAVLGGVFLAITGGEALYADMGHVGRVPIRIAWFAVVLPALLLSYAGQTAMLIGGGDAGGGRGENPFFRAAPGWAVLPLVGLATLATIIASQAIITGAFSLTRQAIQLGWLPGMAIRQTSAEQYGQIYVPVVNWLMMAFTLALTIGFGSSDRLAGAYGTAVSTTMLLTTVLLFNAMRGSWGWNVVVAGLVSGVLLVVDLAFFSANLLKIADGGWIPLLTGLVIYLLMTTWRAGIDAIRAVTHDWGEVPAAFLERLTQRAYPRVAGTGVFLTRATRPIPALMVRHVEQFGVLPRAVVSLTVEFDERPRVDGDDRVAIERIDDHFYHVTVRYGFIEVPNLRDALAKAADEGCDIDLSDAIFFGGRDEIVRGKRHHAMARWRQMVFSVMYRNAIHMVDRFELDGERFVEIGRRIVL
jgi:KUP system potassium uptake protein